jgi:hypothetical protein
LKKYHDSSASTCGFINTIKYCRRSGRIFH